MDIQVTPLVSVIMTCWNVASYLSEALASIAAQSWTNFELFMVDDGSSDGTWLIMQHWVASDSRFRAIRFPRNQGVVAGRNAGLALASGEFIAMLDGDDVWAPDALVVRLSVAAVFPQADVIATDFSWFEDEIPAQPTGRLCLGPHAKKALSKSYAKGVPILLEKPFEVVATTHFAWVGATLVRREAMKAVGNFDPTFDGPEDTLLWLQLASRGSFAFTPKITAYYRQRAKSIVSSYRQPKEFHYLKVLYWLMWRQEFSRVRMVLRPIMAECHHVCAIHFRRETQWEDASFHASRALKLKPMSLRYWRDAAVVLLQSPKRQRN